MYERILITLAVAGSLAAIYLFAKRRQLIKATRASRKSPSLSRIPTIVYFWSQGCPVCKMTQRRILDEIVAEYGTERLTLKAHNTDEELNIAREWGVMTLPTTYVLDSKRGDKTRQQGAGRRGNAPQTVEAHDEFVIP